MPSHTATSLRACAVLAGGGAKGVALVGALAAAEDAGIQFVGYGGASAGAIVALLSSTGADPALLQRWMGTFSKSALLDDSGAKLDHLLSTTGSLWGAVSRGGLRGSWDAWKHARALKGVVAGIRISEGLYGHDQLIKFLHGFVAELAPGAEETTSFADLRTLARQRHPTRGGELRVLVSDVANQRCLVPGPHAAAIRMTAVSASYPILFKPWSDINGGKLTDGGITSNTPSFLFADFFTRYHIPTFVFDLMEEPPTTSYFEGLIETVLRSREDNVRRFLPGVYHIPLRIERTGTLAFDLPSAKRTALYNAGYAAAAKALSALPIIARLRDTTSDLREYLRLLYGSRDTIEQVLSGIEAMIRASTTASDVAVNIMLPTGRGTRMVVYHSAGMAGRSDSALELRVDEGISGTVHERARPLLGFREQGLETDAALSQVPTSVRTILSVPIFASSRRAAVVMRQEANPADVLGTLNVDSSSAIDATGWEDLRVGRMLGDWVWVIAALLRPWRPDLDSGEQDDGLAEPPITV